MENAEGYPIIKHRTFAGPGAPTAGTRTRRRPLPVGEGARWAARPAPRVPAGIGRQHLRDELRRALRQRDRGAQPGRRPGRLPAEHRRGRALAVPPQRRRPGLPDRYVVLRLPRRERATSSWPGSRTWSRRRRSGRSRSSCRRAPSRASAACSPAPRSAPGDRRGPRHRAGQGLRLAEPAQGVLRRRLDARLRRDWSPTRPGCRSASSRPSATWSSGTTWSQIMACRVTRRGLRQRRRRRGRHRCGADDLRGRRRLPVPRRVRPGLPPVRGRRADRGPHVHRRRQARASRRTPSWPSRWAST